VIVAGARNGRHRRSSERGANLLAVNIVGAVLGAIFVAVGIGASMGVFASTKAPSAQGVLGDIASKMQAYYNAYGSYPSNASFLSNTAYFPLYPTDPSCGPYGTAGCTGEFTITANGSGYLLTDTVAQRPSALSGVAKAAVVGTETEPSTTLCGTSCSTLMYSSDGGYMGK
jgi:type II secretory pathway pseudopilin PulG